MKYTINLDANASAHMVNYAQKVHLDGVDVNTDSAISAAIEHLVYAHSRGEIRDVTVTATRSKAPSKWSGMLTENCYKRGYLPHPGYWSKPLGKKMHLLCLESQFPGCVVRKKDLSDDPDSGLGAGHVLDPKLGAFQHSTPDEWKRVCIGLSGQKRLHGIPKRKATVGDLIVTLKLLYRCHNLPIPTQFA